ncbi:P63C domain-containing protein [Thermaerobacillus caldiproteolyticus]|uniref:P63C domain-containing protein n=1 Tax=Thermaerobacillus caldiproteolyticus TaxID=247480 RepID=UPI00188AB65F|nr:P63C domain-containing protein [Anoxybacillus caldiproteolyticus]QPA32224.1 hypothetical protein ISX45_04350 [Anoxybacillus caldiproteolyticus]
MHEIKRGYVEKCLKMPYAQRVGYFKVGEEKIYAAIEENGDMYFNKSQQELVQKYKNELLLKNFVDLPRAVVADSVFYIGETAIECSVLNDGRRVIKDTSLFAALDRSRKGEYRQEGFPPIIGANNIATLFMELYPDQIATISPIEVARFNGSTGMYYDANAIPLICDLYMEAEYRNQIVPSQKHVLAKAKILLRSLAKVGITALIDEATNYQDVRGKDELQILLSQFIAEELRPYTKEFDREYFKEIFRLYDYEYDPTSSRRPRFFAAFTKKYVYDMLPPHVWEKLDEINPLIYNEETGRKRRKYRIHQYLSEEKGIPFLRSHLKGLIKVMKLSEDHNDFKQKFQQAFAEELSRIEKMKQEYQMTIEDVDV